MSANPNRNYDLIHDVRLQLENTSAVTDELPNGADDIHPGPRSGSRDDTVALIVSLIGGSAARRGSKTQASRLVQVKLEVSSRYYETQETRWVFDIFDAVEDALEGLGGGGRAPDGRGGAIAPQYSENENRYVADATFRYSTIH